MNATVELTIEVILQEPDNAPPLFVRGDANADGELQISDGIRVIGFLFLGTGAPTCLDAADTDDNGAVELTDAVRIFGFLFLGQAPPPAPGPAECGPDGTTDMLNCVAFERCP